MTYCTSCQRTPAWGHSRLCMLCLSREGLLLTADGAAVNAVAPPARATLYAGRYRFRGVRCGKRDCSSCPHHWYAYLAWRVDGLAQERYLGPTEEQTDGYQRPALRAPKQSFGSQALASARQRTKWRRERGGRF